MGNIHSETKEGSLQPHPQPQPHQGQVQVSEVKTEPQCIAWRESWERKYYELIQFKIQYGHCNVPQDYKQNNSYLGLWVMNQRRLYKYMTIGKPSLMDEERIERLNRYERLDQIGFQWYRNGALNETWDHKNNELLESKKQHGHGLDHEHGNEHHQQQQQYQQQYQQHPHQKHYNRAQTENGSKDQSGTQIEIFKQNDEKNASLSIHIKEEVYQHDIDTDADVDTDTETDTDTESRKRLHENPRHQLNNMYASKKQKTGIYFRDSTFRRSNNKFEPT